MSDALFREKAPWIMRKLMDDFGLGVTEAAAILGNLGHESGGFKFLQELKPMVPGSKGGWGWAQWTGPRRKAFEAYVKRNKLDPASDEANYAWLFLELKGKAIPKNPAGDESAAIAAVKQPGTLRDKVIAFEAKFERAGVKHYDSRVKWALVALEAFSDAAIPIPAPDIEPPPVAVPEPPEPTGFWAAMFRIFSALIRGLFHRS